MDLGQLGTATGCLTVTALSRVAFVGAPGPLWIDTIANAKNSVRITRKTRFLKKAGFPDLSGKNFYHIQRLH
jgi:hypothetical protein